MPVAWDDSTCFQDSFMQKFSFCMLEEVQYQVITRWKPLGKVVALKSTCTYSKWKEFERDVGWFKSFPKLFQHVFYEGVTISWGGRSHYTSDYVTWFQECRKVRWFGLETTGFISTYWQVFGCTIRLRIYICSRSLQEYMQKKAHALYCCQFGGFARRLKWTEVEFFCLNPSLSPSFYSSFTDWSCIQENWAHNTWNYHPNVSFLRSLQISEFTQFRVVSFFLHQDQVSGTTTSTVLKNLEPNTEYTVTLVPVYHEMEGKSQAANGKTSEFRLVCGVICVTWTFRGDKCWAQTSFDEWEQKRRVKRE